MKHAVQQKRRLSRASPTGVGKITLHVGKTNRPRITALTVIRGQMHKRYFSVTALDVDPPRLLRTVMFSGYFGQESEALKRPLPLLFKVPMKASVAVT
jgi:hypothetical protein